MLIVLTLGLTLIFSGCEKKDNNDNNAPELPPLESMVMDFGAFTQQKSTENAVEANTSLNWTVAALTVVGWNSFLIDTLAIPVAAFAESFNHAAVKDTNDTWKWSYSVSVNDVAYTAELYGKIVGTNVQWKMYVSQAGGFSKFLWFEGLCDISRTGGTWTLNENPGHPNEVIGIVWSKDWTKGTGDIKYMNVRPNNAGNGDYIQYGITDDTDFDAFYDIYDHSADNLVQIKYDRETHEGKIFYAQAWHCWDGALQDVTCP